MFERMLIGRMENRVLVGVLAFVVTMILLGWAAINEGGRMVAFAESEHARTIEQGASLYVNNCTTCHGIDGRGLVGLAPGLNNPQFFGHDFFAEITKEVTALNKENTDLTKEQTELTAEQTELTEELAKPETTDERKAEINTRLGEISTRLPEISARLPEISARITELTTPRDTQIQAALDKGYDPARFDRLDSIGSTSNIGWSGTRESFILTTLIHGRPVSGAYWPRPMPTWGQIGGGPLRMDQLESLVNYIMNWDKGDGWTLDDLFAVNQFAVEPGAEDKSKVEDAVGTDVAAVLGQLATVTGDPERGDKLFHGLEKTAAGAGRALPCAGCHLQGSDGTGPMAGGIATRVQDVRLADPALVGFTLEQYLVDSILNPSDYIAPSFSDLMPKQFGERLQLQDLADIVAYLKTLQ